MSDEKYARVPFLSHAYRPRKATTGETERMVADAITAVVDEIVRDAFAAGVSEGGLRALVEEAIEKARA